MAEGSNGKFALVGKLERGQVTTTARKVLDILRSSGHDVQVESQFAKILGVDGVRWRDIDAGTVITVGGDGTILKTLENLDSRVLGINEGRLGFLTELDPDHVDEGLGKLLEGDYFIEERQKLRVSLNGVRLYDALNEAVIHTSVIAKMQMFEVRIDNMKVDTIRADGMIVATPTGSTGYSMSVGGPLMDPRVDGFILVPIAAFKLSARALVVPNDAEIEIRLMQPKPSVMVLDGQYEKPVSDGDEITFSGSERSARFIRFKPHFYDLIAKYLE